MHSSVCTLFHPPHPLHTQCLGKFNSLANWTEEMGCFLGNQYPPNVDMALIGLAQHVIHHFWRSAPFIFIKTLFLVWLYHPDFMVRMVTCREHCWSHKLSKRRLNHFQIKSTACKYQNNISLGKLSFLRLVEEHADVKKDWWWIEDIISKDRVLARCHTTTTVGWVSHGRQCFWGRCPIERIDEPYHQSIEVGCFWPLSFWDYLRQHRSFCIAVELYSECRLRCGVVCGSLHWGVFYLIEPDGCGLVLSLFRHFNV